jgi:hypothetical protein
MRAATARQLLLALLFGLSSCGDDALGTAGAPCNSSEECAAGLLCDLGKKPHVCATSLSVSRDMAVRVDGGSDHGVPLDGPPVHD